MIRGILRNVQYLFLFFSVLLVFLALQRLQYLPQHYNYSVEGATVGGAPLSSSNELKSLYYYRGDETKEIGLRSFRVGVFKFILPSFSSSSSASSSASSSYHRSTSSSRNENNDSYYLTVPPPNDKPNKSVAYILDLSTTTTTTTTTTRQSSSAIRSSTDTTTTTIANKAKTLSKSIQRMHATSKYGYKLYALVNSKDFLRSLSSTEEEGVGSSSRMMNWLSKLGFEIIDSTLHKQDEEREGIDSNGDDTNTSHKLSRGGPPTNKRYFLYKIWRRHDIIIHLLSAGMELHSSWTLDGLFDILVSNNKNKNNNNSSSSNNNNRRFPGIDSFLLQPHHSYTSKRQNEKKEEKEILIFNGSSHQAYETYRKFLSCLTTADNQSTDRITVLDDAANNKMEGEQSKEGNISRRCMDEIDSNRGLAMCMYHEDFIDCSESMLAKDAK